MKLINFLPSVHLFCALNLIHIRSHTQSWRLARGSRKGRLGNYGYGYDYELNIKMSHVFKNAWFFVAAARRFLEAIPFVKNIWHYLHVFNFSSLFVWIYGMNNWWKNFLSKSQGKLILSRSSINHRRVKVFRNAQHVWFSSAGISKDLSRFHLPVDLIWSWWLASWQQHDEKKKLARSVCGKFNLIVWKKKFCWIKK